MSNENGKNTARAGEASGEWRAWSSLEETHQLDKLTCVKACECRTQYERDTRGEQPHPSISYKRMPASV